MPAAVDSLPIHAVRREILEALSRGNRLVLTAPTGSGKTTQVPRFLMEGGAIAGRIVVLQPRRLACRVVARRVAAELGCPVGQRVGYQTRFENQVSDASVIRFVTEGLFLRQFQAAPHLPGVGAVVLDEFHERNLASDVALGLVRRLQETSRPDLRLVVMSATLDAQGVARHLGCPSVAAHGRLYPVALQYLARRSTGACWDLAADALAQHLDASGDDPAAGDVLVFMPGMYEIQRALEACRRAAGRRDLLLLPLHGEMPPDQQDAALAPAARRKVIVATNVAETSITVPGDPGVRLVIDSGLARVNRFDARRGINVLLVEPVSRASADQRAGRAGRTAPGECIRLWTEQDQRARPAQSTPEVQRLDLAEVALQLRSLEVVDLRQFPWLEPPGDAAVDRAQRLLGDLGAVDAQGGLSAHGRAMARLPMHPRLSRMLIEAGQRRLLRRAALWAALISERDVLLRPEAIRPLHDPRAEGPRSDLTALEAGYEAARAADFDPGACAARGLHAAAARDVDRVSRLYLSVAEAAGLGAGRGGARREATAELVKCLLAGFPDHVAVFRGGPHRACEMAGGRRGTLDKHSLVDAAGLVLPVEVCELGTGTRTRGSVRTVLALASAIDGAWLEEVHPQRLRRQTATIWNSQARAVESADRVLFDDLVIEERARGRPDPDAAARLLAERVQAGEITLERWDRGVEQWMVRVRCVAQWFPERRLIAYDADDQRLLREEICAGAVRASEVRDRPCLAAVRNALSWEDQHFVEAMAPDTLSLPHGKRLRLEYAPGVAPRGGARIQDLFDLRQHPTVAGGRVRVRLEILGPNFRPVQVTDDLPAFWKNLYPAVRKELARKYPKHEWR